MVEREGIWLRWGGAGFLSWALPLPWGPSRELEKGRQVHKCPVGDLEGGVARQGKEDGGKSGESPG